jgi:putative holliday junction resolvase
MRFLGLDIGTVKIGVALSDESGTIASPLTVLSARQGFPALLSELERICTENEVGELVVGLPLSLGGGARGESARTARTLGDRLAHALGMDVTYIDERFTTAEADRMLVTADVKRQKRKAVVDKIAAALLLQAHLDARSDDEP